MQEGQPLAPSYRGAESSEVSIDRSNASRHIAAPNPFTWELRDHRDSGQGVETIMSSNANHRYTCGQHVTVADRRDVEPNWSGGFRVTELLPYVGDVPRYRIASTGGTISRVAKEHQLSASFFIMRELFTTGALAGPRASSEKD
jgi:hypothetical protein